MPDCIAIIPARGGSKRIPNKNMRDFLGKPIISYSIKAALESSLFNKVIVSTDSNEIAAIAKQYGASVPFMRSAENSGDYSTTADVISEVLSKLIESGESYDAVCCIYPTAPFVTAEKLIESYTLLNSGNYDSVLPVCAFSYPIQRSLKLNERGQATWMYPQFENARSQDLEKSFHDAGQFYWMKTASFIKEKKIVSNNTGAIILDELEVQDIDNEADWKLAELKYQRLYGSIK
jgi:pseudaminic acid cytidylyltransferase